MGQDPSFVGKSSLSFPQLITDLKHKTLPLFTQREHWQQLLMQLLLAFHKRMKFALFTSVSSWQLHPEEADQLRSAIKRAKPSSYCTPVLMEVSFLFVSSSPCGTSVGNVCCSHVAWM